MYLEIVTSPQQRITFGVCDINKIHLRDGCVGKKYIQSILDKVATSGRCRVISWKVKKGYCEDTL